jgi:hypothetical protein
MRAWLWFAALATAAVSFQTPEARRTDWVDPDTGHRVVRLSDDAGGSTLYFHDNAFTPEGDKMMFNTPNGIAVVEVAAIGKKDAPIEIVATRARGGYFARRSREIYYNSGSDGDNNAVRAVYAVNVDTRRTRTVPHARGLINADETLSVVKNANAVDPDGTHPKPPPRQAVPQLQRMFPGKRMDDLTPDQRYSVTKEDGLAPRALNPSLQSFIFTSLASGRTREVGYQYGDLNHLQFNPVDPNLLLYCHEGTWHELDRTWTIRTDGSQMRLMHKRTMDMEINGHEWWSWDGKTVWFDLQTPRSEDFWIGGVRMDDGRTIRYHLQRDWWGVHFTSSRDDTIFASDGGDPSQVAYASNGMWINLLRVQPNSTVAREKLVNMSAHNYVTGRGGVEPNVHITPDKKWVVFTGQFGSGPRHVYAVAIDKASGSAPAPPPGEWTTAEDHRHMMEQLGIRTLRPAPSGNPSAPNQANYDESVANPYPKLPDPLMLNNGTKVTTGDVWWKQRRPEIVEAFEREVVGRIPAKVPKVAWRVAETATGTLGGRAVTGKQLVGHVDNSAAPSIQVDVQMTLVTPAAAAGPVPVMIMFRGGSTLQQAVGLAPPDPGRGGGPPSTGGDPPATEQLIADGWGFAFLNPVSIQADNGAGLTNGIIGLVNKGGPRTPDDWGSLRAWSWGAARALDYLETDRAVDAARVGIEGVSRYGKAALVTMAFESRFAVVLVGSSGEGGAKLHRRNFGEAVENLTAAGEYHWMAGNFMKYGASDAMFGSRNAGDIPVDAHELIALCAPRPTFISYGIPEKGDAKWLDQQGSFMAAVAAGPVFRLLGAKDLGTSDDYTKEKMPAVNVSLLDGQLAWRQHDGGHTDAPNWKYFIPWADRMLDRRSAKGSRAAARDHQRD